MPAVSNSVFGVSVAAAIATSAFLAPVASADQPFPALTMSLTSNTGTAVFNPADYGASWANPNKTFGFTGEKSSAGQWGLGWSMLVNPDPFIVGNFVVTNNSLVAQTFTLSVSMPIVPGLLDVSIGGSITGTVTDLNGNGASLSSTPGGSIYSALIDGSVVATLLDDHTTSFLDPFQSAVVGPDAFGEPIPSDPGPDTLVSMSIELEFTLSAGDAASFTSIFVLIGTPIPAPAGLALLGVAGMFGSRRRRQA